MPWIDVSEPHAKPPRVKPVRPDAQWNGDLDVDRGWAELADVELERNTELDLSACSDLTVGDSSLSGISFSTEDALALEIHRSLFVDCDLSQVTVRSLRNSRLEGCKLIGTDLSGTAMADVVFERCSFRYTNLRMAKLSRVHFIDCSLDEVDAYQLEAEDVEFPGTNLSQVNVDQLKAERFDLRDASEISLTGVGRLAGCLLSEHQLPGLASTLAFAAGIDVERPPTD